MHYCKCNVPTDSYSTIATQLKQAISEALNSCLHFIVCLIVHLLHAKITYKYKYYNANTFLTLPYVFTFTFYLVFLIYFVFEILGTCTQTKKVRSHTV